MVMAPIDLAVFHDNGYARKQCRVTNLWFWTVDSERDTCGDTSEDEYTFIGNPLISGFSMRGKELKDCLLYTSPSPRDTDLSRMPSSA